MTDRNLIDKATEVMANSYSPYSNFKVGAAVECTDGTVFTGCNVENAAYRPSICAESAAIATAVSTGRRSFRRIAVISQGAAYCFPCGVCRQMLMEFSPEMEVLCARADGRYVSYPLTSLLPMAFVKEQMGD
ncbi:MAG: cytidine deaminase [Clostridiales bacterium]|nr:cytidine deaminase [Clostridiales bacterium]